MKAIKILFLSVFLIFLVNTVSAVVVYGEWNDNYAQSFLIEDRDSADFSAFLGTISPPMTISVKLYDSGNDLIHTFKDDKVNQNSFAQTYTVNKNIYSMPGDFQVRILGSDNFGEMSCVLSLKVINYPPVINSDPVIEVDENELYSYDVEATDPDNHALTYSLSTAPEWLSINSQTGLITGTAPDVIQDTDFSVSVVVSDGIDTDIQSYTLTVIWIPNPLLSQTVEPVDYIFADYHTTLSELDSAVLEVYYKAPSSPDYGTIPIATRNINTPSYTEIFNFYDIHEKTKGDYRFILEAVGYDLNKINEIDIPDYAPVVGSIPDENFNEEGSIEINLPVPTDINPEDNPVAYLSAVSLDGKTTASVDSSGLLTLEGNRDKTGAYAVELEFGDLDGAKGNATLEGEIYNLPDISGVLENNENDTEIQGVIRVYYQDSGDYLPLEIDKIYDGEEINNSLGKIQTTSDGTFSFQINERASELEIIVLQARIGTEGDYQGYVRTIELSGDDHAGVLVRAVPYAPYENNPVIFREFMYQLGGSPPDTRFDFYAEYIKDGEFDPEYWPDLVNYTGLIGIEILSENPFGAENGTFTEEQQNNIKNKILDLNDISGIIGNYNISEDQILLGNHGHFDFYEYHIDPKGRVVAHQGWIIVVPYLNMYYNGLAETPAAGTLVYKGTIYLHPTYSTNRTISHEFGHMFIGSGDLPVSVSMPPNQSVMIKGSGIYLQTTGPADKKAGKLIYEQTFMIFLPNRFPSVDFVYNILGLGFYGENQITGTIIENPFEAEEDQEDFTEQQNSTENLSESEEDDEEDFTEQQNSTENNIIGSDDDSSSNDVNANMPYDGTIYLQSNADKKNIITSLSNIIRQVISFISQKLKSLF